MTSNGVIVGCVVVLTGCLAYVTYSIWRGDKRLEESFKRLDEVKDRIVNPIASEATDYLKGATE